MIKLRLSYADPADLDRFIELLLPLVVKVDRPKEAKNGYYKAYIDLKSPPTNPGTSTR